MASLQRMVPDNSEQTVRIRKNRDTLINVGRGNLLLCVWTIVKSSGTIIMESPKAIRVIFSEYNEHGTVLPVLEITVVFAILTALYLLITILPRLIVSLSAIAEGKGRYSGKLYIPLAVLMILVSALQVFLTFRGILSSELTEEVSEISPAFIIIEITSEILLIEMLIAAARVKKYRHDEKKKRKAALSGQPSSER